MSIEIPHNSLIIVVDGPRGTVYRNNVNSGDKISLDEVTVLSRSKLQNEGPARSQPPESTSQEIDEATFAKQIAEYLNAEAHAGNFESLVLIADSSTLGIIRPILNQGVKQRLLKEFDKVPADSSIEDIEQLLM